VIAVLAGVLVLGIAVFGAVAGYLAWLDHKAERRMVCGFSAQRQCPVESVTLQSLGAATYRIDGCGQGDTYFCKMPGEGCMTSGAKPEILRTQACPN
jgi:hypothetical protein